MPIVSASVPTVNGAKYMQQLCKHWSHRLEVDLSEQKRRGQVSGRGRHVRAGGRCASVTIEGEDGEIERMKGVVASHLDRFAFREAPLRFDWA